MKKFHAVFPKLFLVIMVSTIFVGAFLPLLEVEEKDKTISYTSIKSTAMGLGMGVAEIDINMPGDADELKEHEALIMATKHKDHIVARPWYIILMLPLVRKQASRGACAGG